MRHLKHCNVIVSPGIVITDNAAAAAAAAAAATQAPCAASQ